MWRQLHEILEPLFLPIHNVMQSPFSIVYQKEAAVEYGGTHKEDGRHRYEADGQEYRVRESGRSHLHCTCHWGQEKGKLMDRSIESVSRAALIYTVPAIEGKRKVSWSTEV